MAVTGGNHGGVPSLESFASDVFLKQVIYKTTSKTVEAVREVIDQILIGKVKKSTRENWADSFYQSYKNYKSFKLKSFNRRAEEREHQIHQIHIFDVFAVLDSILDEHFQELTVSLPFPPHKSFPALMSIITRRCTKLEALEVEFQDKIKRHYDLREDSYTGEPAPGSCLSLLKSLTLVWEEWDGPFWLPSPPIEDWRNPIYSLVGKHCTVLTKLSINGDAKCHIGTIMALVVNRDVADILFSRVERRWNQNPLLSDFIIPFEFLNPLCFTLKDFSVWWPYCWKTPDHDLSTKAFVLRHLTKLELVDLGGAPTNLIDVVEHLYKTVRVRNEKFEKVCIETASRAGLSVTSHLTFIEKPFLLLKKLEWGSYIPINRAISLLAVASLCPHLEEVGFFHKPPQSSLATLGTILKSLSKKIETLSISLSDDHPDSLQIVLETFGSNLRELRIIGCPSRISLASLATVCTKLVNLRLEKCSISDSEADASHWTPGTFFPFLTHFESAFNTCLEVWAPLIERKSSLVSISLDCCHIGTNAHSPSLEWRQISKSWASSLQTFQVRLCTGLKLSMVAELIPQLVCLRRIVLPHSITSQDPELARKMVQDFASREKQVTICLHGDKERQFSICPFNLT